MDAIRGFQGEHRYLSNFWYAPVTCEGLTGATNEHVYQALKCVSTTIQFAILHATSPGVAKSLGRQAVIRPDWDNVKYDLMHRLQVSKFSQHKDLHRKLVATGNAYIEETNHWGDTYWGVCRGKGMNMLGKILMNVRDNL